MFDLLSEKLQATLSDLRSHGTLTEDDINRAMREIRLALLEADVNFKVVKTFTTTVNERGTDEDPVKIASWALDEAKRAGKDVLIVDTAGRLHVDAELMDELVRM